MGIRRYRTHPECTDTMNTTSLQKCYPSEANPATALSSSRRWLMLLIIILTAIGVRLLNLDADPPGWYIPHDVGLQIDEGYKTLDARNRIVFGDTHWNANDDYPGWSKGSPFTQQSYYLAFKAWGLELASARLVSVIMFGAFLLMVAAVTARFWGPSAALLATFMIAVDPALFSFSRVALFEIDLIVFTFIGFFLLLLVKPHQHVLAISILAVSGLVAGLTVKMSGLVYVAPASAIIALAFVLDERFARFRTRKSLIIVSLLVLALLVVLFLAREIWIRRVAGGISEIIAHPQVIFWNNIAELSPFLLTTAYLCIIHTIAENSQLLRRNLFRMAMAATVVLAPVLLNLFGYNPPRYSVPIVPAAIMIIVDWLYRQGQASPPLKSWHEMRKTEQIFVAGLIVMTILSLMNVANSYLVTPFSDDYSGFSKAGLLWTFPLVAAATLAMLYRYRLVLSDVHLKTVIKLSLIAYVVMSIGITGLNVASPSYDSQTVRTKLVENVEDGRSIAGDWAAFFAAESNIPSLYVSWVFNRAESIEKVRPDYFLFSDIWNDQTSLEVIRENPGVTVGEPIALGNYYRADISLYPLSYLAD